MSRPKSGARKSLRRCAGTQFDTEVVQAFCAVIDTGASNLAIAPAA